MPFTKIDSWDVDPGTHAFQLPLLARGTDVISLGRAPRQLLGTVVTLTVHVIALYLLLTKLSQPRPFAAVQARPTLTVIDIGADSAKPGETESGATSQPANSNVEVAEVDQPAVQAEWAMVRIKVRRKAPAVARPEIGPSTPAANGAAAGGGYDPYAGAAPENLDRLLTAVRAQPASDEAALIDQVRRRVIAIDSRIRFPLTVRLKIAADGRIISASFLRSTTPAAILARLGAELKGDSFPALGNSGSGQARQLDLSL